MDRSRLWRRSKAKSEFLASPIGVLVLTVAKAKGVEQVYVEHDNPADGFASLASSYRYLKG
jgi:hypothetical protein